METEPAGLSKAAKNEELKLLANSMNAVGLGAIALGLVTPAFTDLFSVSWPKAVAAIFIFAFLHGGAHLFLQQMED